MSKMNNMNEEKLNVLKDLFIDESHTLDDLKRLKDKSQDFFKIEQKTGKILIQHYYGFTVKEKIILLLIGKYFCEEVGYKKENITSKLISKLLHIQQTSLTAPLGDLVLNNILSKKETSYTINYYKIENQLDVLNEKYISEKKNKIVKNKITEKKSKRKPKSKYYIKKETANNYKLRSKENIKEYIRNKGIEIDDLSYVFNLNNNKLIILDGYQSPNNREIQIKATLLIFFAYNVFYDTNKITSANLRRILQESGVSRIIDLSTTIKKFRTWIIHERGQIGSTNTYYKITPEGLGQALILFKDSINQTTNFQSNLSISKLKSRENAPELNVSKETLNKNIGEFAKSENFDENELKMAFEFDQNYIRIIEPLKDRIRKIEQIKNLLLLGYIIKKIYKQDKFNCYTLLKSNNINADRIDLLDSNKAFKNYFSLKKPKSAMSLFYKGEIKAKECLEKYLKKGAFDL